MIFHGFFDVFGSFSFRFGYDHGGFLEIALESNTWRRMACVLSGGLIGSAAWFWLRGRKTYLVTVDESLKGIAICRYTLYIQYK